MSFVTASFLPATPALTCVQAYSNKEDGPIFFLRQVPPLQATGLAEAEEPVKGLRIRFDERAPNARP